MPKIHRSIAKHSLQPDFQNQNLDPETSALGIALPVSGMHPQTCDGKWPHGAGQSFQRHICEMLRQVSIRTGQENHCQLPLLVALDAAELICQDRALPEFILDVKGRHSC
mmetsp:Transcript_38355/g.78422  ORF Transcript_38355/g.78422 Transcript_38355/m.78422 type:complete len:110 (+) Transcript_38355:90-419(+)